MRKFLKNTLEFAAILSLLFHLSVWLGLKLTKTPAPKSEKSAIEIVVLDQRRATPNNLKRLQIVEQNDKPLNDETPDEARFLGQHNQRVVKETRASQSGDFRNSTGQGPSTKPAQKMISENAQKTVPTKQNWNGTLPTIADLKPRFDPGTKRMEPANSGNGSPQSQTNDYLKDLPPSLETVLSTREFVYFTYYQRIRSQIRQYWEPSIREKVKKIFAAGRSIASEKDHVTRVIIVLDQRGNLMKVQIVGASGLSDLDDAAVEAFRAAEPFPNPPKGIIEPDGTIRINWDFILEAGLNDLEQFQRFAKR